MKLEKKPGEFVIIDQFIDLVSRPMTFFDGTFSSNFKGKSVKGVQHTDMTYPYSSDIREIFIKLIPEFPEEKFHEHGTYVMFNGPRFETSAEINMFSNFGDVVGMTGAPEVILARELGLEYASLNLITNYGAGIQSSVAHEEVIKVFEKKVEILKKILIKAIRLL